MKRYPQGGKMGELTSLFTKFTTLQSGVAREQPVFRDWEAHQPVEDTDALISFHLDITYDDRKFSFQAGVWRCIICS